MLLCFRHGRGGAVRALVDEDEAVLPLIRALCR